LAGHPHHIATELVLGFQFTVEQIYEVGFLNRLVDPDDLIPTEYEMPEHADIANGITGHHRPHEAPDAASNRAGFEPFGDSVALPWR
jgi:hypothetical protein